MTGILTPILIVKDKIGPQNESLLRYLHHGNKFGLLGLRAHFPILAVVIQSAQAKGTPLSLCAYYGSHPTSAIGHLRADDIVAVLTIPP